MITYIRLIIIEKETGGMTENTEKATTIQVRLNNDFLTEFDKKCKEEHRNRSETIRMLMENYIKEKQN
jgi:metal-responsive CopG/Arc/MetJ family transcriptional regulator